MEIWTIDFGVNLVLLQNNERISITPLTKTEDDAIRFGIDAPKHVPVNRQEIYHIKSTRLKSVSDDSSTYNHSHKIQEIFREIVSITCKSEKLERAAKELFDKEKILTPKTIERIALGEQPTTAWILTCAIDVLIKEKPIAVQQLLSLKRLYQLWAKPLLQRGLDKKFLLKTSQSLNSSELAQLIKNSNVHLVEPT